MSKTNRALVWSLLVVVAFLWGVSFLASTIALKSVDPMELLAVRWGLSAILFLILIASRVIKVSYKGKPIKELILMAIFQPCLYSLFELLGIKYTSTSESSIMISLIPIMVIIIAALFYKQHYSRKVKFAVLIAFLGVLITTVFSPAFSIGGQGKGFIYLILAIITSGFYNLMVNNLSKHYSAIEISATMVVIGGIFYNIISLCQGNGIHPYQMMAVDSSFLLAALFLGFGCSFGAYFLYNYILTKMQPGIASCLQVNGVTLVGVIAGIVVMNDPFGWYTVVGMILLTFGIAVASLEGNKDI